MPPRSSSRLDSADDSVERPGPRRADDLDGYGLSKGTIRFTADRPLPDDVVTRVVELRRAEIDG